MNVIDKIQSAGYVITDEQIEQLAQIGVQGDFAGVVYLRAMIVDVQSRLGAPTRGRRAKQTADVLTAQDEAINLVHERMYAHVLKGVAQGVPDMTPRERQQKATKFRSVTSTIRAYVRAGNDLRTVDAATVTKSGLRAQVVPRGPTNRVERAEKGMLAALKALLALDEEAALAAMDRIREELDQLEGVEQPESHESTRTHIDIGKLHRTPVSERAGAQLHRGA